jgi:hypothetical protein
MLDLFEEKMWKAMLHRVDGPPMGPNRQAFYALTAGSHVYPGLADAELESPMGFECVKNTLSLYGIFEHKIECWLPLQRRDNSYLSRIRLGMKRNGGG